MRSWQGVLSGIVVAATAWPAQAAPPAQVAWTGFYVGANSGFSFQPTVEFGVGGFSPEHFISTTLPSSASGSDSTTNTSLGIDLRVRIPIAGMTSLAFGGTYRNYYGGEIVQRFDLDSVSPGNDTDVTLRRDSSALLYGGVSIKSPTLSAYQNGRAGLPGSGTFDTTIWAGWRHDKLEGNIRTNELGAIRQSPISASAHGYSVGVDVDYPLWMSGFDTLWNRTSRPVVRLGLQYDSFGSVDVSHQANFATYSDRIEPRGTVTGKVGLGWQFYPGAR